MALLGVKLVPDTGTEGARVKWLWGQTGQQFHTVAERTDSFWGQTGQQFPIQGERVKWLCLGSNWPTVSDTGRKVKWLCLGVKLANSFRYREKG